MRVQRYILRDHYNGVLQVTLAPAGYLSNVDPSGTHTDMERWSGASQLEVRVQNSY
jgi:hypothetical protein